MKLKFTKAQICTILEKYYKEQERITGKVTTKETTRQVGFEMYPDTDVLIEIKINGEVNLDGVKVPLEKEITNKDLENAINYFLSEFNQEVEQVSFDKGHAHKTVGYGMYERQTEVPYFNGVTVKLKNKTKENRRKVK